MGFVKFFQQIEAVTLRHPAIKQDDIWRMGAYSRERLGTGRRMNDMHKIFLKLENRLHAVAHQGVIIDQQNTSPQFHVPC